MPSEQKHSPDSDYLLELIQASPSVKNKPRLLVLLLGILAAIFSVVTALSYAVQLAFYKAQDDYTLFPEVDTGRGYADLIYIPKRPIHPALLVELKYNQNADTALEQIQRQKYPSRLEQYKGNLILVGISYDRSADPAAPNFKHHSCKMIRA